MSKILLALHFVLHSGDEICIYC